MARHAFQKYPVAGIIISVLLAGLTACWIIGYRSYQPYAAYARWGIIGTLSFLFLSSVWTGRPLARRGFLALIIVLTLFQASSFIDFTNLDRLFVERDFPKFYTFTVEHKNALLQHGSPFGFNHDFQGGIPMFYGRSCFLEFIPFSLLFGDRQGYQIMLLFFVVLIPVSLYLLVRELVKNEEIARAFSFVSTFQLGLWPFVSSGLMPGIVSISLSFLAVFCFVKYLYNRGYPLFFVLFLSGLLAYTYPVALVITWMAFAAIFVYKLITGKDRLSDARKLASLGSLHILVCLPLIYQLLHHASFFRVVWRYTEERTLLEYARLALLNLASALDLNNRLFVSTLFLLGFYVSIADPEKKLIVRNCLITSVIVLFISVWQDVPLVRIVTRRFIWIYIPFLYVFNLSLVLLLKMRRSIRVFLIMFILLLVISRFLVQSRPLRTVGATTQIDKELHAFVSPGDYVLFENSAHLYPGRHEKGPRQIHRKGIHAHWTTYLQKELDVKFFSHMGDDAHPYNNLRHMYITNGYFNAEPLCADNKDECIALLKEWGVNKACVWSKGAVGLFEESEDFTLLGTSERYTCFGAAYGREPEVALSKGGSAILYDEGPFSFTVLLENITEEQKAVIKKNYFDLWSAQDEDGEPVPLSACGQKICFDVVSDGHVYFTYRKNAALYLIPLFALFICGSADSLAAYRRTRLR